ncbi:hypothetical protein TIFTF001_037394 [Ficus carica]|uniref:Uncharacterized protein n=1 Tax=Ficus carica TaxID=3494 RepID=A0AA88JDM4_FICCA|nr:hypothetical protein TIFTF001_037394 [Ficus carica]
MNAPENLMRPEIRKNGTRRYHSTIDIEGKEVGVGVTWAIEGAGEAVWMTPEQP